MRIGPYLVPDNLLLAPMAGVTDRPFRRLCMGLGAGLAVSEMVAANPKLWRTQKTRLRTQHEGEPTPRSVQILGADPQVMADAARFNVDRGAQIIDVNMGCPAKKVCKVSAGSALMADEILVGRILDAVVRAVDVPVTLKMRTGPAPSNRNGVRVARLAESAGVAALAVHGRTRACGFRGGAEYGTVAAIKRAVKVPVVANGDVDSPDKARFVLEQTGADAIMIGRAAQGNPWIFREIACFLATGRRLPPPPVTEVRDTLLAHLAALHVFYGEQQGVRIARKHLCWYCAGRPGAKAFWGRVNRVDTAASQLRLAGDYFNGLVAGPGLAA